jgi:hypothetical protein
MQTTKTKVINSCLNPVWNEEMTFSMKEPVGIIKFVSFYADEFYSRQKSRIQDLFGSVH